MAEKENFLIVCTQNSSRSQMAEGFFRKYAGDIINVYSAGYQPTSVHPYAIAAMKEIGIDISGQKSKSLIDYLGWISFGHVIAVCQKAAEMCPATFPGLHEVLSWPFDDPAACKGTEDEKMRKFREVRDEIDHKVMSWLQEYQQRS
ncbi:MAG: arsenate reductase ArsC [Negativicutes bacterium]|nr:arsenate reductase ArsC [Negativicutes bacterium]